MKRITLITLLLAVALGAAFGWWFGPRWHEHRALAAIAAPDLEVRRGGWSWLLTPDGTGGAPRAADRLADIDRRLGGAGDEAVLHAAHELRGHGLWGWGRHDLDLVLREISARSALPLETEKRLAAEALMDAPFDLEPHALARFKESVDRLLATGAVPTRHAAFAAVCAWAGRDRAVVLEAVSILPDDPDLQRRRHLALSWSRPPAPTVPLEPGHGPDAGDDVLEALLLRRTVDAPEDAALLFAVVEARAADDPIALDAILRYSDDLRAVRALEQRERAGSRAARYALQARSPGLDVRQARSAAGDRTHPASLRRMAAWRWDAIPPDLVREIVDLPPADNAGEVFSAALLAERRLPRPEAIERAEIWIRSFDDDEKRAGALLAALLGTHVDLLAQAFELEDMGRVRTTQRLALWALGARPGDGEAEFAFRTLHGADGDFRADTALCMLLAGDEDAIDLLCRTPGANWSDAVRRRAWLLERFVPSWHAAVGRPIGGSERGLRLHFDRLAALRMLTRRRMRFDGATRTYSEEEQVEMSPVATP